MDNFIKNIMPYLAVTASVLAIIYYFHEIKHTKMEIEEKEIKK